MVTLIAQLFSVTAAAVAPPPRLRMRCSAFLFANTLLVPFAPFAVPSRLVPSLALRHLVYSSGHNPLLPACSSLSLSPSLSKLAQLLAAAAISFHDLWR